MSRSLFALLVLLATVAYSQEPQIEVYFSPHGGVTDAIVKELDAAKTTVLVQAYSFTSVPIAKALVEAKKRGVNVQVILDRSNRTENYSEADFFTHSDIPIKIDALHQIAHNKIIVIDGSEVITGSFNFTKQAEISNAENLLVIRDRVLAAKYTGNWKLHAEHSQEYKAKELGVSETHRVEKPIASAYVASSRSQVFHRADCAMSPQNIVQYATREEAIQAGKRPCKKCEP